MAARGDRADGLRLPARSASTRARASRAKRCEPAAGGALLVGQTMIGWRVWDVMRTIDYIATRPELDASRVGCMGISGGGTVTLFATALEPRIRVATRQRLPEHVPRQHRQPRALHRQLRAGHSELGRDARRRRA